MCDADDDGRAYTIVVNDTTSVDVPDTATAQAAVADMAIGETFTIRRTS